jgi:hypothetical protein
MKPINEKELKDRFRELLLHAAHFEECMQKTHLDLRVMEGKHNGMCFEIGRIMHQLGMKNE